MSEVISVDDNHDMSLSTLIISVERDIELLDQMEMKSGDTTGGSAKLLSLPGYRPRDSTSTTTASYPATPPPLPRKTRRHRRHNSDSTINTSYEDNEEDFPSTPSSPTDTYMADEVTRHMIRRPVTVFCPYCLAQFFHHKDLQEHLLHSHSDELHALREDKHYNLRPETCPCCQAEFLKPGLGSRHLVHHHPQFVCTLMLGNIQKQVQKLPTSRFHPSTPPPERHTICLCGQRFLKKNVKLLALHLQQQHPDKFSRALEGFFGPDQQVVGGCSNYLTPNISVNTHNSGGYLQLQESPPHIYESVDTPLQKGRCGADEPKSLLRNNQLYDTIKVKEMTDLNDVRRVRAKNLYESFPHTPQRTKNSKCFRRPAPLPLSGLETYHGVPQPEPPSISITGLGSESYMGEEDSISLEREKENYYHYTYNSDKALFRCNLCANTFTDNSNLLQHLKTNHMAVSRALKAQFSCARCPAKFFKNAFLLKHSLTHTEKGI